MRHYPTTNTHNELVAALAKRAGELSALPINALRAEYPEVTETRSELVQVCVERGFTRAKMVEDILSEEFLLEYDRVILQDE